MLKNYSSIFIILLYTLLMSNVGLIGLGVMGKNIVYNLVDHGFTVHVYNRTISKVKEIETESKKIVGFEDLNSFVESLSSPRRILLMVSAGSPVDEYLLKLDKLLDKDDIVIDSGNSDYRDTIRRYRQCNFNFVGCGMSGGEYGARTGLSIMPGCKKEAYVHIKEMLEAISAKHDGNPCCKWLGPDGAGHFVKIVHNGIEYCEMQLFQELLNASPSRDFCLSLLKLINSGRSESYLAEIFEKILNTKNEKGYVLYQIKDKAEQKGTGKVCVEVAIDIEEDISFIGQSVFSRYLSNGKDKRVEFHKKAEGLALEKHVFNSEISLETIEKAFYLAKSLCFIQGGNLLMKMKTLHGWPYKISDICDVWKNGCILRCKFLDVFDEMSKNGCFETSQMFLDILKECLPALKELSLFFMKNNIYSPVFNGCLMWIYGMNMDQGNGNLLQAMRDYFGRHGVILENNERVNIEWCE